MTCQRQVCLGHSGVDVLVGCWALAGALPALSEGTFGIPHMTLDWQQTSRQVMVVGEVRPTEATGEWLIFSASA